MDSVAFDKILDKIVALGVPGLVLIVTMSATGFVGAAAITTALATLGGPLGMLGGIGLLGLLALISKAVSAYGVEIVFKRVLEKLIQKGHSIDNIESTINGYWFVSSALKTELKRHLALFDRSDRQ